MNQMMISRFPKLDYACNEAINTLCTNLFYCGDDIRTVLFTSRYEQEGKSSIAMNVMRTLAGFGKRVVLIDADLRCSSLARRYRFVFTRREAVGLAQYLAGMCELEDAVYETDLPNAYILPAGREVLSSLQLLASPRYKEMMETLKENFDVILVDLPPVTAVSDALIVSKLTHGMVVVVRQGYCDRKSLDETVRKLRFTESKILGFVMTGSEIQKKSYYKKYYKTTD